MTQGQAKVYLRGKRSGISVWLVGDDARNYYCKTKPGGKTVAFLKAFWRLVRSS